MRDIFLSQPTCIPKKQNKGIEDFCKWLKTMGLNPRTLGKTDSPVTDPLNEVLKMLKECSGMIVLGVPQIRVKTGTLKEKKITKPLKLATEWNQIEAALAYSKKMPLLIIHDIGVSRGIFDHGALANFIHEVDFNDKGWYLKENIMQALKTWEKRLPEKRLPKKRLSK